MVKLIQLRNHYLANWNFLLFGFLLISSLFMRVEIPKIGLTWHYPLMGLVSLMAIALNWKSFWALATAESRLFQFGIVFYTWIWISALNSEYMGTAIRYAVKYSIYAIAFLACLSLTTQWGDRPRYQKFTFRFILLIAFGGILESAFPHCQFLNWLRYPDHYPRISSIIQGPNQFGVLMALGAILAIILLHQRLISRWEFTLSIGCLIVLICLSASVNSWIVFTLGISLTVLFRLCTWKQAATLASLWLICLLVFPLSAYRLLPEQSTVSPIERQTTQSLLDAYDRPVVTHPELRKSSFSARSFLWKEALNQAVQKPISGLGVGVFAEHIGSQYYQSKGYHAHNLFLSIFTELGIGGLLIFLSLVSFFLSQFCFKNFEISIPLVLLGMSQMFDFFINDYTFITIALYYLSDAVNHHRN